jgi:adenylate cyclase
VTVSRQQWLAYGAALRFAAILGGVFGPVAGAVMFQPPLGGALFGFLSAVSDTVLMMALIGGAELFLPRTRLGEALARAPFLLTVLAKLCAYLAVVATVLGLRFGPNVAVLLLDPALAAQLMAQVDAAFPRGLLIVVCMLVTALLVMLHQTALVIGQRTARDIVRGRYHRPRSEERFFLFVDIVGSTPVAERLGPLAVHRYLDRVFRTASAPVDEHRGEVHQYVGDEMVVTWTAAEGRPGARPLACLLAIESALARSAAEFQRDFGETPRMRAALHAGEVVTGEIGGTRRAIVFHGDVMNTASRIENLTRELGRPFLVSEQALARMDGVGAYPLEDLGPRQLRGRGEPLRVYAVQRPASL